jgi:RNA polymerase sigma-70 factor (ECF subfamily)
LRDGSLAPSPIHSQVVDSSALDFRGLFEAHFTYVWGALRRLGVPEADAEDAAHEVFLQVFRHLEEYDGNRPMRPWLFGFAYRVAADQRRRAHRRHEVLGEQVVATDPAPRADDEIDRAERRSLLMTALDSVDLERRAVLVLHEWDGLPVPEAARALGIPLNTAYSRLRVAREELAAAVKRLQARRGER